MDSDAKILLLTVQELPESACDGPLGKVAEDELGWNYRKYRKAKKDLVESGYLHEWKWQDGRGRWVTEQLMSNVTLTRDEAGDVRDGNPPPESPSEQVPTVGFPRGRKAGSYLPGDKDRDKTSPHPPSKAQAQAQREPEQEQEQEQEQELAPDPNPDPEPNPDPDPDPEPPTEVEAHPPADTEAEPPPEVAVETDPTAPPAAESGTDPELILAERLLLSLRHSHTDLLLGVREARGLADQAAEWLRRGVPAADLRRALTAYLPGNGVRSAVGFLRHRLTVKMPVPDAPEAPTPFAAPPPLGAQTPLGAPTPPAAQEAPPGPPSRPAPLIACEGPGNPHVFRPTADETHCRPCRQEAAWEEHERRYARPRSRPDSSPVVWRDHFDKYAQGLIT
ncbi:hypothetical protein ACWFR1_28965 [Streptomyces sp. NPDC055103]